MRKRLMTDMTRLSGSIFLVAAMWLAVPSAHARINVVTLPGRDTVQLTIYNSGWTVGAITNSTEGSRLPFGSLGYIARSG